MLKKFVGVLVVALVTAWAGASSVVAEVRPSHTRHDVLEIGAPVLVSRGVLEREMTRNTELREYVRIYGWPDYTEVQEIQPKWPWAAYEIRVYYLRRELGLAFARVNVSPSVKNFGVKRFEGALDSETLSRLLTAAPASELEKEGAYGEEVQPAAAAE